MNAIVVGTPLQVLEPMEPGSAGLVYLRPTFRTASMGALAFDPEHGGGLGEHLEGVSRLIQAAHRVLADHGTLFIWSDALIDPYHRMLADRIFGAANFATQVVIPGAEPGETVHPGHTLVAAYGATPVAGVRPAVRGRTPEETARRFPYSDERGPYLLRDLTIQTEHPALRYEFNGVFPREGRGWRLRAELMAQLDADDQIVRGAPGRLPSLKVYMAEVPPQRIGSVWESEEEALGTESESWPREAAVSALVRAPAEFMARIIAMGSQPGDRVVAAQDIAGSFALAAARAGRPWIAGLNHEALARVAEDRLARNGFAAGDAFRMVSAADAGASQLPYRDFVAGLVGDHVPRFVLGEPVPYEETLHVEFKEVKSARPVDSIKETADRYAVAFLNREGGRIFWGIRNEDRTVVGVRLSLTERDEVRKGIVNKLSQLQPAPTPNQYDVLMHPVRLPEGGEAEVFVVEMRVAAGETTELYCTSGWTSYMKTPAGIKKLEGRALFDELKRRAVL
jgi:hypothetical protein